MRVLYSFLIILGTPFVLFNFAMRGFRERAYLDRWRERFGFAQVSAHRDGIWVHAASVGEFKAGSPLIRALLENYPDLPITVTTQTPTGSAQVTRELGEKVFHSYIPFDLPGAMSRFINRVRPRMIIVLETEIWPNLFLHARRRGIPLLMANARLSDRSIKRFQWASGFVSEVLKTVSWIGAQSTDDMDRFIQCGSNPQRTDMTGNLKYDMNIQPGLEDNCAVLRSRWERERPVLVAGSTHEADENMVIPAFVELLKTLPDALLILVPRRPERFAHAAQLARTAGLQAELRSQTEMCSGQTKCFLIDSMGELMIYYAFCDVAFVGGSIGDQGGHNPLEPAALGKPVLFGPNMVNAREIAAQLLKCQAAIQVEDGPTFKQTAERILTDKALRDRMGQAGRTLVESNKGALDLTLKAIQKLL